MNKDSIGKAYIGDGVYIMFDGWSFVLTAENGITATDTICLDLNAIEDLNRYVGNVVKNRIEAEE